MVSIGSPIGLLLEKGSTMKKLVALIVTATAVAGFFAAPAQAADTTTTFSLTTGSLSVSAPSTGSLSSAAAGAATISASLGSVTVTDARGALAGIWTASASSTDFVTGTATASETIAKGQVTYTAPVPTIVSGTVAPLTGGPKVLSASQNVVTAASIIGNNVVSWNPTVLIALPAQAVAGSYTGTITHSIA